jgi:pimeloyl-ACP methyl ester carboxylesterase
MRELLKVTAERALHYLDELNNRNVAPKPEAIANLQLLDEPLPEKPTDSEEVVKMLDEIGSPATVATAGPRYFGFVVGGSLPAAVAANWLATVWDQNAGVVALSPIAAKLEEVAMRWLLDILELPSGCGVGFVTCATQANFSGLAAARHALLARQGWDVEARGLFGAPPVNGVVGDEVHVVKAECVLILCRRSMKIQLSAFRQGTSIQALSIPPMKLLRKRKPPVHGFTWMVHSDYGQQLRQAASILLKVLKMQTRGQRMPTSG